MEWFKLIIELLKVVIWPITILIILRYRHDLFGIISKNLKSFKYGSAEFDLTKDLTIIESSINKSSDFKKVSSPQIDTTISLANTKPRDTYLIIAQTRIDFENELYKLYRTLYGEHKEIKTLNSYNYLDELVQANKLPHDIASVSKEFLQISSKIIHNIELDENIIERASAIGYTILKQLHYRRKVLEMEEDFQAHGLWHMHSHIDDRYRKFYFYSAVAASVPEFDYSYEIYKEAAENFNNKEIAYHGENSKRTIFILTMQEFIESLEFREKELSRLINSYSQYWNEFEKANKWQWPKSWGNLGWTGPIIRDKLSLSKANDELLRTKTAIEYYRSQVKS
jgi:hypothetical protein